MPSLLLCLYAFLFLLNVLLSVICEECRFLYLTSLSCTWVGCLVRSSLVCHNNLYRGSAIYISSPSLTAAHSYELSHTKREKRREDKRREETRRDVTVNDVWENKESKDEHSNRMQEAIHVTNLGCYSLSWTKLIILPASTSLSLRPALLHSLYSILFYSILTWSVPLSFQTCVATEYSSTSGSLV